MLGDDEQNTSPFEERMKLFAEQEGITIDQAITLADKGARVLAEAIYRLNHSEDE